MAIKARIWWDVSIQSYKMTCTWSDKLKPFLDAMKPHIPYGDRDWDEVRKEWYFKEHYGDFVRILAEKHFGVGSVSFVSKTATEQAQKQQQRSPVLSTTPQAQLMTQFVELLPYEAAKKAYLIACQSLHPDKPTGDGQKQAQLNAIWERLEKEVYRR